MLTIFGDKSDYCDGVTRRSFLRIGGLSLGGISLPGILQAEQQQGSQRSHKSIIMILLPGGPPQLDMFDMKRNAPAEIRGEFSPIQTNVPGIEITELMPRTAAIMDKLAIIRSLYGARDDHNVHQCLTGWETHPQQGDSPSFGVYPRGGWPSIGAVAAKVQGPVNAAVPPFISLAPSNAESMTRASLNQAGFLGMGYAGFQPNRRKEIDLALRGITLDRLADRKTLHASLDRFRRDVDTSGVFAAMDTARQQAFGILTSSRLGDALDFKGEDLELQRQYGISDAAVPVGGGPELLKQFLLARRLVEAGVRCVTLAFSPWPLERESRGGHNWDWHAGNFVKARRALPMLDVGLSALVRDLDNRDMLGDVSIVVWGEFGRTPRINAAAGRDHWPQVASALLAGGGMKTGQVIGATDRHAGEPVDRPVHYREVFATLYQNLGIDPRSLLLHDSEGRPQRIVDDRAPIRELV